MNSSPYIRSPDNFWLMLPHASVAIEVTPFESAYGTTDENLVYYNGVLLGLATSSDLGNSLLINLLPKLDRQRSYPWPSEMHFQESLASLLRQALEWSLVCEQDCDQVPVPEVCSHSLLFGKLAEIYAYSRGEENDCPTFRASASSVDA
jgi:hypothetical protein